MGFIPIFITLGGFVFLFVAVVHQNFLKKRKEYQTNFEEFTGILHQLHIKLNAPLAVPKDKNLEHYEKYYYELKNLAGIDAHTEHLSGLAKSKLIGCRRARHQYDNLLTTKPYSFVASIMGHKPI